MKLLILLCLMFSFLSCSDRGEVLLNPNLNTAEAVEARNLVKEIDELNELVNNELILTTNSTTENERKEILNSLELARVFALRLSMVPSDENALIGLYKQLKKLEGYDYIQTDRSHFSKIFISIQEVVKSYANFQGVILEGINVKEPDAIYFFSFESGFGDFTQENITEVAAEFRFNEKNKRVEANAYNQEKVIGIVELISPPIDLSNFKSLKFNLNQGYRAFKSSPDQTQVLIETLDGAKSQNILDESELPDELDDAVSSGYLNIDENFSGETVIIKFRYESKENKSPFWLLYSFGIYGEEK